MAPLLSTPLLRTQSDRRLAALAADGHDRAFEAIVERYRRPLQRYLRRLLSEALAEDVLQATFVRAWQALRAGTDVRELRPWLYRIAHNQALNTLRAAGSALPAVTADLPAVSLEAEVERREELARGAARHRGPAARGPATRALARTTPASRARAAPGPTPASRRGRILRQAGLGRRVGHGALGQGELRQGELRQGRHGGRARAPVRAARQGRRRRPHGHDRATAVQLWRGFRIVGLGLGRGRLGLVGQRRLQRRLIDPLVG